MATESDKVNVGALGTIVVVGALAMLGIASAVTALVRSETDDLSATVGANANLDGITAAKAEQNKKLDLGVSWVDKASGKIHIPIERAMQVVVENLERNPESATPPPPPSASASAAPVSSGAAPDAGPATERSVTEGAGSAPSAASAMPNAPEPPKTKPPTPAKMHAPDSPAASGVVPKAPKPAASTPAHAPSTNAP